MEIVSDLENVKHQQELYGDIGVTLARSGNHMLTRRIISVVVEANQKALILCELASKTSKVKNQGMDKDFNEIQLIISKIEDTLKRDQCLVKFIEALALNGRYDWAFQTVSDITNAEKQSESLVNIVGCLSEDGLYEKAYDVARNIEIVKQKARAFKHFSMEISDVDESKASDIFKQTYSGSVVDKR
ncbi:hypothetical protein HC928_18185 [bacterium]|nr:hypothetical protein [bacterium]